MNVDEEVRLLQRALVRLGAKDAADGLYKLKYGVLFRDEEVGDTFEALLGTLKAAKKRGVISFKGELLLQNVHDEEVITLLKEPEAREAPAKAAPQAGTQEEAAAEEAAAEEAAAEEAAAQQAGTQEAAGKEAEAEEPEAATAPASEPAAEATAA